MADFNLYLTKMSLAYQGSEEERLCGDLLFSDKDIQMGDKRLNNLAAYTYNSITCQKLFVMIEKALTPTENPWKTIYKSLLLLHTIVLFGSELAIDKAIDLCRFVRPLGTYNSALAKRGLFSGGGGTDYGAPVRAAAKTVDDILLTDASIRKARGDARQGQDSLVPMGDLLDDGSGAAAAEHNREFNPSHGVQMNYGQGLTTSVGAGFGLQAVPGIYEGRPERYFDSDSTRKHLLQSKSVQDSQRTRDAQAPSLLDMVFEDTGTGVANLPPADYLPALERQRELEALLLAQQEQLRQLQDLQREQQRLQDLQRAQQQQPASLLSFPYSAPPPQQGLQGPYGASGVPPAYGQSPVGAMGGGLGQPYQQSSQFQGISSGMCGLGPHPGMHGQAAQSRPPQQQGAFDDLLGLSNAPPARQQPQYGMGQQQQQSHSPYGQPQQQQVMGGGMQGLAAPGYPPQQHGHSPAYGQQAFGPGMTQGQSPYSPAGQQPPLQQYQHHGGASAGLSNSGSPYGAVGAAPSPGVPAHLPAHAAQGQPAPYAQHQQAAPNHSVGYGASQGTQPSYQMQAPSSYPPPQQQGGQGHQGQYSAHPGGPASYGAPPPVPSSMPSGPPPPVPSYAPPF